MAEQDWKHGRWTGKSPSGKRAWQFVQDLYWQLHDGAFSQYEPKMRHFVERWRTTGDAVDFLIREKQQVVEEEWAQGPPFFDAATEEIEKHLEGSLTLIQLLMGKFQSEQEQEEFLENELHERWHKKLLAHAKLIVLDRLLSELRSGTFPKPQVQPEKPNSFKGQFRNEKQVLFLMRTLRGKGFIDSNPERIQSFVDAFLGRPIDQGKRAMWIKLGKNKEPNIRSLVSLIKHLYYEGFIVDDDEPQEQVRMKQNRPILLDYSSEGKLKEKLNYCFCKGKPGGEPQEIGEIYKSQTEKSEHDGFMQSLVYDMQDLATEEE